jgi:hydrogenase maturation protease
MTSAHRPRTLVLGLGNPILTDDRVGLEVARAIVERLPQGQVALAEASVGGLELLHVLEGSERVLIVDAWSNARGGPPLGPGEAREMALDELDASGGAISPHTAGLGDCLAVGRACGLAMPAAVRVFVIGAEELFRFGERCTPAVEAAIPAVADQIVGEVFGPGGWG